MFAEGMGRASTSLLCSVVSLPVIRITRITAAEYGWTLPTLIVGCGPAFFKQTIVLPEHRAD